VRVLWEFRQRVHESRGRAGRRRPGHRDGTRAGAYAESRRGWRRLLRHHGDEGPDPGTERRCHEAGRKQRLLHRHGDGQRRAECSVDGGWRRVDDVRHAAVPLPARDRADIRRTVTILPNGIDTLTESDKPEVATKLKVHVSAMYVRLREGRPIHQRDPLFAELFSHADQIDANITYTDKGLHVVETSTDPAVAHLLHKHAETVDRFIKNGMPEMMKDHLDD